MILLWFRYLYNCYKIYAHFKVSEKAITCLWVLQTATRLTFFFSFSFFFFWAFYILSSVFRSTTKQWHLNTPILNSLVSVKINLCMREACANILWGNFNFIIPVDTRRRFNVYKTLKRRHVSTGIVDNFTRIYFIEFFLKSLLLGDFRGCCCH